MKQFRQVLKDWMDEMHFNAKEWMSDGTPIMGKFESEELYREARKFLAQPEERVAVEQTERAGAVEVRTRIYYEHVKDGDESFNVPHEFPAGFTWYNMPATVRGDDFEYKANVLCSFPKSSGKIRYVVEDAGRLFIQKSTQIFFDVHSERAIREEISRDEAKRRNYMEGYKPPPPPPEQTASLGGDPTVLKMSGNMRTVDISKRLIDDDLQEEHQVVMDEIQKHNTGEE